jgi:hypothetical protein
LQKVARQANAAADDIRNSGTIDGRCLQDFANDYQNCTALPPTKGGPCRFRKKLREKFFVAFNAYQEVQKERGLPALKADDYFNDLDALTALTTGHTAKKRQAQDNKVTNSSNLSTTTYTNYILTGLRGDLVKSKSELKPLTSSDVCDLRITSSNVVIGILMRKLINDTVSHSKHFAYVACDLQALSKLGNFDTIIDTGASGHVVKSMLYSSNVRKPNDPHIALGDNSIKLTITYICDIGVLKDVMVVPQISLNLISGPRLDIDGFTLSFKDGIGIIRKGNHIIRGYLYKNLYFCNLSDFVIDRQLTNPVSNQLEA